MSKEAKRAVLEILRPWSEEDKQAFRSKHAAIQAIRQQHGVGLKQAIEIYESGKK